MNDCLYNGSRLGGGPFIESPKDTNSRSHSYDVYKLVRNSGYSPQLHFPKSVTIILTVNIRNSACITYTDKLKV